jgi:imidazole glycerol-phosphate synthase subunit HisF
VLKARIIPTLLYRDFGLVKGVRFDSRRAVGSPLQAIKVYEMRGVDELVFLDVTATLEGRRPDLDLIDDLADECFMPLTVGGGIVSADDVGALLRVGADKVCIGTAAVERPAIVTEAAERYGAQCVVVAVDTRTDANGRTTVWTRSGTCPTEREPVELAAELQHRGAGEVLLTSIDRDGTMEGYDLETIAAVAGAVSVPLIASGGAGSYEDLRLALTVGSASAVAAASIFHYTEQTPREAKWYLGNAGIPVRR